MWRRFGAKMTALFLIMTALFLPPENNAAKPQERDGKLSVMFWNLENFFDWRDGGMGESDREFSSKGPRHWTSKRFYTKCNAIAKAVLWVADKTGGPPDVIGLCEVENAFVLRQMVTKTVLRKMDYSIVHYDSPDSRGIDCGLLYRDEALELISSRPHHIMPPEGLELATRDILEADFRTEGGDTLTIFVNHHPSKYGGGDTDWRREAAVRRLGSLADSLAASGRRAVIAIGDFNDTPDNQVFTLLSPALVPHPDMAGQGSIRFNGLWQLIDLCFISPFLRDVSSFEVFHIPFLTVHDAGHSGEKPFRTYSGPRYIGGVSDHCPVCLQLF